VGRRPAAEAASLPSEKRLRPLAARNAGVLSVAAYLVAVAACEAGRHAFGFPEPADVALTPAALADGKVWLLVTSALLVSGPALLELGGVSLSAALLVRREGAAAFWRAAAAGHVGGTLVAYTGVCLLWLADRTTVDGVVNDRDFGVSGVWLGVLGALFASAWRPRAGPRGQREHAVMLLCATGAVIGAVFFPPLSGAEHALAFVTGTAVQLAWRKRPVVSEKTGRRPIIARYSR
jgi:hypothetical protein